MRLLLRVLVLPLWLLVKALSAVIDALDELDTIMQRGHQEEAVGDDSGEREAG